MSMGSRIRELRELRKLSRNDLARMLGVSPSSISNYENDISAPNEEILYNLFEILKCDANFLYQDYMDKVEVFSTTFDEQEFIRKLRLLGNYDRKTLNILADRMLNRSETYTSMITHPVFLMPASAGTGQFLDSDEYELVDFPEDSVPRDSNFAVRVSGDSMEPDYPDKSIVFIKQVKSIEPGEVGIFIVNNEGFLKILGDSNNLISINPDYNDIQIQQFDECRLVGKVVGVYNE